MSMKKTVLICDDNAVQRNNLSTPLRRANYFVEECEHCSELLGRLETSGSVSLVVLDLGYGSNDYIGHEQIRPALQKFSHLKFIIYSDLLARHPSSDGSAEPLCESIFTELRSIPQVVSFLSAGTHPSIFLFHVHRAIGSSEWLQQSESTVSILHVSDSHFGSLGMRDVDPKQLAFKVCTAVDESMSTASMPSLILGGGDFAHTAKPSEFASARDFFLALGEEMRSRHSAFGMVNPLNLLCVPGNHDVSWHVGAGRCVYRKDSDDPESAPEWCFDRDHRDKDLQFLDAYCWIPYLDFLKDLGVAEHNADVVAKGWSFVDLSVQLNMVVALINTSFENGHFVSDPDRCPGVVPAKVFQGFRKWANAIENSREAGRPQLLRVLVCHHTLYPMSKEPRDQLQIEPNEIGGNDYDLEQRASTLFGDCRFSLVLTGHNHTVGISPISTLQNQEKCFHVGCGPLGGVGRKYDRPGFALVNLTLDGSFGYSSARAVRWGWTGNSFKVEEDQSFEF